MLSKEFFNNSDTCVVTDIIVQKNDNTRFSVFLNNHFAFGISYNTYEKFQLKKNDVLDRELLENILLFDKVETAKLMALKYLGNQARTEFELRQKLKGLQFDSEIIENIIQNFKDRKYIDDLEYTQMFTRDFIKFKKDGIFKLRKKLQNKGVRSEIIETVINEYASREEQLEKALDLGQRKFDFLKNKENKKEKIYRFLLQKGFETTIVKEVLQKIFSGIE